MPGINGSGRVNSDGYYCGNHQTAVFKVVHAAGSRTLPNRNQVQRRSSPLLQEASLLIGTSIRP
jgi:hypothetical protein